MKRFFLAAGIAVFAFACTNDQAGTSTTNDSTGTTNTTTSNNNANAPGAYVAGDGDVSYRDGRVMVWRNNEWTASDEDVTLSDGTVVRRNGRVVRNGEEVEIEDGTVVDRTGRFFDKAGNAIEDGWEGLKKGAGKAAEGVEKGFNEAKEGVKDAVNDNDKKNQ